MQPPEDILSFSLMMLTGPGIKVVGQAPVKKVVIKVRIK